MELLGHVKYNDWGKIGLKSFVAQMACLNNSEFCYEDGSPYAEFWMGDLKEGPAIVKSTGLELGESIDENLKFHVKILSIEKPLELQIHPNKEDALRLFLAKPEIYNDPIYKPKLIIALTSFVALCGFRTHKELYTISTEIRPLGKLIGEKSLELLKQATPDSIEKAFREVIYTPKKFIKIALININREYKPELRKYRVLELFKKLFCKFPEDVGVMAIFFLNVIQLLPNQSIFFEPNTVHAYISGDCLECTALSNNVIRGALTKKYRDLKQFMTLANYTGGTFDSNIFQPIYYDIYKTIYNPPIEDFAVVRIKLPLEAGEYSMKYIPTGSILVVVHGAGVVKFPYQCLTIPLRRGNVYYIPPCAAPELILEPVWCEKCEDVPPLYDIAADLDFFSYEIHSDKEKPPSTDTFPSRTPSIENAPYRTSSSCDPDIEKFSSSFIEECEEEALPVESEDTPIQQRCYSDFEVFIISENVYLDFLAFPSYCCPAMKPDENSDF